MFFIQGRLDLHRPEYERKEETDDGEKTVEKEIHYRGGNGDCDE